MPEGDPVLVQEQDTGEYGLRYPGKDVIETYDGDERVLVDGSDPAENWQETDEDELRTGLKSDIEEVREGIHELRAGELTDQQERELDRLESRLESQANLLSLLKEVDDA